jgi:nucleotide-binding universal stress UspA family protein
VFNKILVPLDGSEFAYTALDYAIDIAKKFSSELLLVHIVPTTTAFITGPDVLGSSLIMDLKKQLDESGHRILTIGEAKAKKAEVNVTIKIDSGNPVDKILKMVNEEKINLIVMGHRGLGRAARFFLGSVSDNVSHKATCPILIVK